MPRQAALETLPHQAATGIAFGLAAALCYLAWLSGSPNLLVLIYLAPLPLCLAGLWLGPRFGTIAAGIAALATVIVGGVGLGLSFFATTALPILLLVPLALRSRQEGEATVWYPAGRLVAWLLCFGAAGLVAAALILAREPGGLEGVVRSTLTQSLHWIFTEKAGMTPELAQKQAEQAAAVFATFMPGASTVLWLTVLTLNGAVAQTVLSRLRLARRPTPEMATLQLPLWLLPGLVLAGLAAIFAPGQPGYVATNLCLVFGWGYFIAGLGFVHAFARRYKSNLLLIAVYVVLIFVWPVLAIAAFGILDQLFGLRRRLFSPGLAKEKIHG
jgi:hypothetical protein